MICPRQVGKITLACDLQAAPNIITKCLAILETLFIIFLVRPYHHTVARAILKDSKTYFFDTSFVRGDEGAKFENACAAMLLKHTHFRQDILGQQTDLHSLQTKDGAQPVVSRNVPAFFQVTASTGRS